MSQRLLRSTAAAAGLALAACALAACTTPGESEVDASSEAVAESVLVTEDGIEIETVETIPVSIDEYVATMPSADEGWTLIEGVRSEYETAAAIFPFPLPEGFAFPAASSAEDPDESTQYSAGTGGAEVYAFWRGATALAAHAAHLRGDIETAEHHLDTLAEASDSPVAAMYYEDPDGVYAGAIESARRGTWGPLRQFDVNPFLSDPAARAIADAAGDL